jgi:hypothetical protein
VRSYVPLPVRVRVPLVRESVCVVWSGRIRVTQCALPRLRELSKRTSSTDDGFVVLLDDDLRYRAWALTWLERAITDDETRARHACARLCTDRGLLRAPPLRHCA